MVSLAQLGLVLAELDHLEEVKVALLMVLASVTLGSLRLVRNPSRQGKH